MLRSIIAAAMVLAMAASAHGALAGEFKPDPAKLTLARRYIEVMRVGETLDALMVSLGPVSARGVIRNLGVAPDSRKARLLETVFGEVLAETVSVLMPRYVEHMSEVYAQTYTEEELEGLIAFYSSPVGQSVLQKTPAIAPDASAALEKLLPEIDFEFQRRLCKRLGCSPSVQAAVL